MGAPPQRVGLVISSHVSVKIPAFGDLNMNGNFKVSPGKITSLLVSK